VKTSGQLGREKFADGLRWLTSSSVGSFRDSESTSHDRHTGRSSTKHFLKMPRSLDTDHEILVLGSLSPLLKMHSSMVGIIEPRLIQTLPGVHITSLLGISYDVLDHLLLRSNLGILIPLIIQPD
jgi:hypothetical protein